MINFPFVRILANIKVIAEFGSNWNGSEKIGKKLIKYAKMNGANYAKFQMWRAADLYKKSHPFWNEIKKSELSAEVAKRLKLYADSQKIDFLCSVFYPEAVDVLESLNVKLYKVASLTSAFKHKFAKETLQKIAKTKKPVVISMGLGGNRNNLNKILSKNKKYFLYCIAKYPTKISEIDFKAMEKFDGFSDHTKGLLTPLLFAVKSRKTNSLKFFEKHISIKESKGPDKPFSMDMNEFTLLISEMKKIKFLRSY